MAGGQAEFSSFGKALSSLATTTTVSILAAGSTNTGVINNPIVYGPTYNLIINQPKDEPPLPFESFITVIKAYYLKQDQIKSEYINPTGGLKIDQLYVNVAIVNEVDQAWKEKKLITNADEKKEKNNLTYSKGLSSFEEIYGSKDTIPLEELFDNKSKIDNAIDVHRLLLYGRAGIGKSTLLQYMVYRWAQGQLWPNKRFKVLILLPLKQLANGNLYKGETANIAYVVHRRFGFGQMGISVAAIQTVLKEHADAILYLADGFDEVATVAQQKEEEATEQGELIRDVLHQGNLLLSTRPNFIDAYCANQGCGFDRKIENIGFLDKDIDLYIERFFGVEQRAVANQLKAFLNQHPSIRGATHIPIILGLICSIWRKHAKEIEKLSNITMTVLYQMLLTDIAKRAGFEFSSAAFDSTATFLEEIQKIPRNLCFS